MPASPPPPDWSEPALAATAALVYQVAGLVFPLTRRASAEASMRRTMKRLGIKTAAELREAVEVPGAARAALLAELTVGESYFFREAAQLEFLRRTVLASWAPSWPRDRQLNLWSAGCASGEEPYSLAIVLREQAWPSPTRIVGTDVSLPRLAAARRGRYTKWALRGVDDAIVGRWFSQRGSNYDLAPEIRAAVEFRSLNLASIASDETMPVSQDVIFCRNVLIYFDERTVATVAKRLLGALAPDGWLFLGASDPLLTPLVPCEVVTTGAGLAYRRSGKREPAQATVHVPWPTIVGEQSPLLTPLEWPSAVDDQPARAPIPVAAVTAPAVPVPVTPTSSAVDGVTDALSAYAATDYDRADALARDELARGVDDAALWIVRVRSLANRGDLAGAGEVCAAALDRHRDSAELHYLHAMLLAQASRHADAAQAARRAIYLDRTLVVGHIALGEALSRSGDPRRARIAFESAVALLDRVADDAVPLAADGVPVARLRGVARARLAALVESPAQA